jgi:hypothetical protein
MKKITTGTAFDRITRQRERRPGEPDERDVGGQGADGEAHCFEDIAQTLIGLDRRQRRNCRGAPDRVRDARSLASLERQTEPQGLKRQQNVGEEDCGVDAQTRDGLQRYFSGELGVVAQLEDGVLLAQGPVLGHVAPRLPHEPDRRYVGPFPAARLQETAVSRQPSLARLGGSDEDRVPFELHPMVTTGRARPSNTWPDSSENLPACRGT